MRSHLVLSVVLIVIAGALAYAGFQFLGTAGLALAVVIASPLIALAVLYPMGRMASASITLARQVAYRHMEGRHYEFKGLFIDVQEDLTYARWLRTSDVRKVLPALPRDSTLQKMFPEGLGHLEARSVVRISASTLDDYLQKATDPNSLRFRAWLRRTVIRPSEHWRSKSASATIQLPPSNTAP